MKKYGLIIGCFIFISQLYGQQSMTADSLQRPVSLSYEIRGNTVFFQPQTPPLIQTAGAPKAYWTYYWEFGDGHFSRKENPSHIYSEEGDHEVSLWATNHYDSGKTPPRRPQQISIPKPKTANWQAANPMEHTFSLQRNREPKPSEEIVVIMRYKNSKRYITNGKLYLFFNEKKYHYPNFELKDVRTYYNERKVMETGITATGKIQKKTILLASNTSGIRPYFQQENDSVKVNLPLTLEKARMYYQDAYILEFDEMLPQEERNVFFTFRTTPEMLEDTSAVISIRGIYVPDRNYDNHHVQDMKMEVVTSYDPNKMSSNTNLTNFRLVRAKNFKFKIRFQNTGEGPANTIRLETQIPEFYNAHSIKVIDQYPDCPICPEEKIVTYSCLDTIFVDGKATFTFKNIYLPGTRQKNVEEIDSTKGFVRYQIKLAEDIHKQLTKTRTAIYFDKNDPIYTNYAVTRFTPGISIGAKAGFMFNPEHTNQKEYFVGATVSPYKSYQGYFQAELMLSAGSFDRLSEQIERQPNTNGLVNVLASKTTQSTKNITFYAVPVSYHYNLSDFFALEGGVQVKIDLSHKVVTNTETQFSLYNPATDTYERIADRDQTTHTENSSELTSFQAGAFVGFHTGFVRVGPSIGARYVFNINAAHQQIQLYAIWKF